MSDEADEYKEVVAQFRVLTEIRFKLIAFLPLGTAATIFLSRETGTAGDPAIAAFAVVATVCLAVYNKRNDQHYDELIGRAAQIERDTLRLHGAFNQRPKTWLGYGPVRVEHRWPIGLIYAATTAFWAHVFGVAMAERLGLGIVMAGTLGAVLPISVFVGWFILRAVEKERSDALKASVQRVLRKLQDVRTADDLPGIARAIVDEGLIGKEEVAMTRLNYQWALFRSSTSSHACLMLAAVIDMPARWISDVTLGRRDAGRAP